MHESLQPPKLEKVAPKPKGMEAVTLATADKPIAKENKHKVVDFGEDMVKAIGLLNAKLKLDEEIKELGSKGGNEKELADLESNRNDLLEVLAEIRPADFKTEAEFEKMLREPSNKEKRKVIEDQEKKKDDAEDRGHRLKGKLRLDKAELSKTIGKDAGRTRELEQQIRETEAELVRNDANRLEAWKALKTLDQKKYGADADLVIAEAAHDSKNLKKATDEEVEDLLANLREDIDQS